MLVVKTLGCSRRPNASCITTVLSWVSRTSWVPFADSGVGRLTRPPTPSKGRLWGQTIVHRLHHRPFPVSPQCVRCQVARNGSLRSGKGPRAARRHRHLMSASPYFALHSGRSASAHSCRKQWMVARPSDTATETVVGTIYLRSRLPTESCTSEDCASARALGNAPVLRPPLASPWPRVSPSCTPSQSVARRTAKIVRDGQTCRNRLLAHLEQPRPSPVRGWITRAEKGG